jgi:hypothetical protein
MVWCGNTKNGATKPYFIEGSVNGEYYTRIILPHAKKEGKRLFGTDNFVNIKKK